MRKLCWVWGPGRTTQYGVRPGAFQPQQTLLQLHGGAGRLEQLLDLLGLFLVHAFLDGLGSGLDKILGFLEAEAGDRTYLFDNVYLLGSSRGQDDVEFGLLLDRRRRGAR